MKRDGSGRLAFLPAQVPRCRRREHRQSVCCSSLEGGSPSRARPDAREGGYLDDPVSTAKTLVDGWLHTGDAVPGRIKFGGGMPCTAFGKIQKYLLACPAAY
jgi:hypothetical protein